MSPRKKLRLILDFVHMAGAWRQRAAVMTALSEILPTLLVAEGSLFSGDYCITVALTDDAHQQELNHQFRGIARPTNVLSFPQYSKKQIKILPMQKEPHFLGDISLSYQCVVEEAARDGKKLPHHIIHLVIHGILHILGYDHQTARQAAVMEQLERDVLATMNIADPYAAAETSPVKIRAAKKSNPARTTRSRRA
jgi:probable rRNA maturation factor